MTPPERHGDPDRSDDRASDARGSIPDAPETTVIAAPDSWKTGVPEGTAGADPSGPLRHLGVAPETAALGRPADQRRLREHEGRAGPEDPPAGGGVG